MILTAPGMPGTGYRWSFTWNRSLVPAGADDPATFGGPPTTIAFIMNVADNTPPTLELPADTTIEGNTVGGAIAAYAVSAFDAEDATAPTPTCSPAVGGLFHSGRPRSTAR